MRLAKFLLLSLFIWCTTFTEAQEVLTGLSKNPVLQNLPLEKSMLWTKGGTPEIHLPMIDDFSAPTHYPRQDYWASKSVFVNQSYAVNPPSIGVITFDAMNDTGVVYSHLGSFSMGADTLLTHNIRLDSLFGSTPTALSPEDSVYLSFYVQPQGMGAAPLSGDSLVLQFYNPYKNKWNSVWNIDGISLEDFRALYDTSFLQVMIPITDTTYFASNFKFRFFNYARIPSPDKPSWRSGLHSHWNVDYLVLDAKRTYDDTSYNDLAIQSYQTSLLKDYQSMPWNQFKAEGSKLMQSQLGVIYQNLDNITGQKNVNQYFYIIDQWDKSISFEPTPNPSVVNVSSQEVREFTPDYSTYTFNSPAPKYSDFKVIYNVLTNTPPPDIIRENDTISFYQRFYNYYSYDDGVPEAGYGLSSPGGQLAYKFTLSVVDTLQSIEFYFNQTLNNANQQYFYLMVWDDDNGKPGNVIYEESGRRPEFTDELFKFHTYVLAEPIPVSGTFYVGWRQNTKDNLNVGFDLNNDHSEKIFYNVSGDWYNSSFDGSLMIRPIIGDELYAHVGIENKEALTSEETNFDVFPNPSKGSLINIRLGSTENTEDLQISVYNLQAQRVHQQQFVNQISLKHLSPGIYFLQVHTVSTGEKHIKKIIIY